MSNQNDFENQLIALRAMIVAIEQASRIANRGEYNSEYADCLLKSVFDRHPTSIDAIYHQDLLGHGNSLIYQLFKDNRINDQRGLIGPSVQCLRLGISVFNNRSLQREMAKSIDQYSRPRLPEAAFDDLAVFEAAGAIYKDHLSDLPTKILVHGKQMFLRNPAKVTEIRGLLLAAVRAAIMWRQFGGKRRNFFFRRQHIIEAIERYSVR